MRRTVRLTERDLSRLVRRVIREQEISEAANAVIPLSEVNDRSRLGPKGTYYVDRFGVLVLNDGDNVNGQGDTHVLSDEEYNKHKL
jgi:hypothetical protein